jgi:hypothetical protein
MIKYASAQPNRKFYSKLILKCILIIAFLAIECLIVVHVESNALAANKTAVTSENKFLLCIILTIPSNLKTRVSTEENKCSHRTKWAFGII